VPLARGLPTSAAISDPAAGMMLLEYFQMIDRVESVDLSTAY
jgi:hypothetical protein